MSERFSRRGEERYREDNERAERDPLAEKNRHVNAINLLMAKIVEYGDLTSQQKQILRNQVQGHLAALGLTSINQFPDFLAQFHSAINDRTKNLQPPSNYPSKREFAERLNRVRERRIAYLPAVGNNITVLEVARYAQSDWHNLKGRGGKNILDYSYDLGMLMSDELVCAMIFEPGDEIKVDDNWHIENGRHRALVLSTLGVELISRSRMGLWIKPQKDT